MRTLERGAVYGGMFGEKIVGFRCSECGDISGSMFGDTCNGCREKDQRHRETIKAIRGTR